MAARRAGSIIIQERDTQERDKKYEYTRLLITFSSMILEI